MTRWKFFKTGIVILITIMIAGFLAGCPTEGEPNIDGFTVTFNRNYVEGNQAVAKIHVSDGGTVGLNLPSTGTVTITDPTRPLITMIDIPTGRQFVEWNYRADGRGKTFTSTTVVDQDLTIYAIWEPKYNLSANMISKYELLYNDKGGRDEEGIYNYQLTIPFSSAGLSPKPGTLGSGKALKLDVDGIACYNLDGIQFKLVDVSGAEMQSISSGVISRNNLIEKTNFFVGNDANNDNLVDPGTGENFTLTASVPNHSPNNHLLISANLPILTDRLGVYAHINLAAATDTVTLDPTYEVDLLKSGMTHSWRYSNILYRPDLSITPSLIDTSVAITFPAPSPYDPPGYDISLRRGGFEFPGIVDVNEYSMIEIEYTTRLADFLVDFRSVLVNEVESATFDPGTSIFSSTVNVANPDVKTTASITLPGNLPAVRSVVFGSTPAGTVTIHKITFKN